MTGVERRRSGVQVPAGVLYGVLVVIGIAAFLYPFWLPERAAPTEAHRAVAPVLAGGLIFLLVVTIAVEIRQQRMNGATVALLGVLAASAGLVGRLQASPSQGCIRNTAIWLSVSGLPAWEEAT